MSYIYIQNYVLMNRFIESSVKTTINFFNIAYIKSIYVDTHSLKYLNYFLSSRFIKITLKIWIDKQFYLCFDNTY